MTQTRQVPREQLWSTLEEAFEDAALLQAGYLRQVALAAQAHKSLRELWETIGLGDVPEYESQVHVRKVS